jgi:uncharacterized protein (TIGR03437 family)
MGRTIALFLPVLLSLAAADADTTIQTTLSVTINSISLTSDISVSGSASLTGIGSGKFSANEALSSFSLTATSNDIPFTITLSDGSGTLTGTVSVPTALVIGGATSGNGSAKITGGTGAYDQAKGTFTTLTGTVSGNPLAGGTVSFSGDGSITTSGGTTGPPQPTITAVLDAASYTANIAQGSIFVVKGTNLSAAGFTQFGFPLPNVSTDGVKITFSPTGGGVSTIAYLVYLFNQNGVNQLAGLLPSTIGTGNYNVIVTTSTGNSAGFPVTVVQRKFGVISQDSTGTGLAVVQNFISQSQLDVNRFTTGTISGVTISPAKPGQIVVIWGTGMGPVSGADNVASPGFDFSANGVNVQVIVGGTSIKPLYAGRAPGLAGADQINVQLPSNIATGCTVPMQISVNGTLSPPTFLAIAPNTAAAACVQPGFTTQQLTNFDNGGSITTAAFVLSQIAQTTPVSVPGVSGTIKIDALGGAFDRITGFQLASAPTSATGQANTSTSGACTVTHVTGSQSQVQGGSVTVNGLDAGNISFTGPTGSGISNMALTQDPKSNGYSALVGAEGISLPGYPSGVALTAGQYTLTGAGGKDVGKFTAGITLGTPLTITGGLPPTVDRNVGLTLNWTGGNATDTVEILGYSGTLTGTGANATIDATEFVCITTAGAKTITVPPSILTQLPAGVAGATTAGGFLEVVSTPTPAQGNGLFTASLTADGTSANGIFLALIGFGSSVTYQ